MFLYRYEVKGIQSFILRSSKLRDIAAASALVARGLEAARGTLLQRHNGEELISAAGSATLRFSSGHDASAFAELWPLVVSEVLPGPQVVAAIARDGELGDLARRLRISRNQPVADAFDAGPLVARAARSGALAVARHHRILQDSVHRRLQAAPQRGLSDQLLEGTPLAGRRFLHDNSQLRGDVRYLALVHADGNGIGQAVIKLLQHGHIDRYRAFSEALKSVTVAAVRSAIAKVVHDDPSADDGQTLAMRPVVVGGDDVTILLRPQDALRFTEHYLSKFEEGCRQSPHLKPFTVSAGVVYAKVKAPFHAVHRTCEELCGWVKRHTGRRVSALALHRITTSPLEPYEETRERNLGLEGVPDGLCGGPYALGGDTRPTVRDLRQIADALSELPRGGIREWLRVRGEDAGRANIRWERIEEVTRSSSAWGPLGRLLDRGHWSSGPPDVRQRSPLLDAMTVQFAEHREEAS